MKTESVLASKLAHFLRQESVQPAPMVVAVSGGPDSVALLMALVRLRSPEAGYFPSGCAEPLVIAHLNHQLRGAESDVDEAFARRLYETLAAQGIPGLQFCSERIDVAALAIAEGGNLEAVARRLRYNWLAKVARDTGLPFVATGHTADDQAETLLHRLFRGTGLKGLRGIAARRMLSPGVDLLRPLLHARRAEVLAHLDSEGQSYRQDSSNLNRDYTRNQIRHDLLPYLAANYNPEIVAILTRLAEQAGEAFKEQEAQAQDFLSHAELPRAGQCLVFDCQRLAATPRLILREIFRLVWTREDWPMGRMGFDDWNRLAEFAVGGSTALDLPDGIRARRRDRVVLIGPVS